MSLLRTDSNYELRVRERMSPHMHERYVVDETSFVCCRPEEKKPMKAKGSLKNFLGEDGMLVK